MENTKKISKRSFSRFFATQILFSYLFEKNDNLNDLTAFLEEYYIAEEFSTENLEEYKKSISMDFLKRLLDGATENLEEIDKILSSVLDGKYTFDTIDNLIKVILRLAIFELKYTDTDKKIIINEYVDIAGEYFDPKGISFVNAVIDKLSKMKY